MLFCRRISLVAMCVASLQWFSSTPSMGAQSETAVYLPDSYNAATKWPMLILLHGMGATGDLQDLHLGISERVSSRQFILIVPDARPTADFGVTNDGLLQIISEMSRDYSIDSRKIFLIGHSMGGYQALSFGCAYGNKLAGMVISSASGKCQRGVAPVKMLLATGDTDVPDSYVDSTVNSWRQVNGCAADSNVTPGLDLQWDVAGAETTKTEWSHCGQSSSVVSLRSQFGRHVPIFKGAFADAVLDFLLGASRRGQVAAAQSTNCVAQNDDKGRYVSSVQEQVGARTVLRISEYSDSQCASRSSTIEYSGPAGQGRGDTVMGLTLDQVSATASSQRVVDDLNGLAAQGLCNQRWSLGVPVVVSGASSEQRQACISSAGKISGPSAQVKKLVLSYVFSPPM
jgi:polyhydroxybutyrate depolymerase